MINEEKILREQMGSKNPFRVPEGYFEHLTDKVMQRLPEETVPAAQTVQMVPTIKKGRSTTLLRRLRPLFYAAACLVVAIFGFTLFFNKTIEKEQPQQVTFANAQQIDTQASDEYLEEAVDYAMLDNQDIYYLLAEM